MCNIVKKTCETNLVHLEVYETIGIWDISKNGVDVYNCNFHMYNSMNKHKWFKWLKYQKMTFDADRSADNYY